MTFVFPQEAIDFLRECKHDPKAEPSFELLSGSVNWDDERYLEFVGLCYDKGCSAYGALFAYRTSLIEGKPRDELRYAWDKVQCRCPGWIGFREERRHEDLKTLLEFMQYSAFDTEPPINKRPWWKFW